MYLAITIFVIEWHGFTLYIFTMPRIAAKYSLVFASIIVSISFMVLFSRLHAMSAFIQADARTAMQESFAELQQQGYWMVHLRFDSISRNKDQVCVHWKYRYRSQMQREGAREITTCHS